jgi:chromosome segregation ATPase
MQLTESRWKNKISELEQLLDESKKREEKSSSEVHALRETISSLDMEIRNLASSLAAESEANETLQIRLERVENEWNKNQLELSSLQRRDRDMSVELGNLNSTIIDNSQMKNELNRLTLLVAEKDRKISELANSKDLLKRSLGGEIQRLHAQLDYTNSRSTALVEKYERIVREKDKMKSLLANDTINRLNRSLLHN